MNNKWKWTLGIVLAVILLLVTLFVQVFLRSGPYRMMNYSYNWHMPMMFLMWFILLGLLILIGLGIAWLVKTLTAMK